MRNKLAAIVGPTAAGKTSAAVRLALKLNAEIICCDSMQVYRGLDIGTGKATTPEREMVPHHLLDVVEPHQEFTVARYQQMCRDRIEEINQRGKLPLLVGGTGLYYQAVVDDYTFIPTDSCQQARERWLSLIDVNGIEYAYDYLKSIDPDYAAKISAQDQKRIIRALEVYELTGQPFSSTQKRNNDRYQLAVVGLYYDRPQLYLRIENRVDEMLKQGLVEEVKSLLARGCRPDMNSMQALGYRQVINFLQGFISYEEMVNDIKKETRRYAKRQFTWFKRDNRIHWLNLSDYPPEAGLIEKILAVIEGQLPLV